MLSIIVTAVALTSFALYAAAIRWFFARPDGVQPGMRFISVCGTSSALLHVMSLYSRPATRGWQAVGFLWCVAGLGLFTWAWKTTRSQPLPLAFSRIVPARLVSNGPYAWLTHPFYTAYSMTWIGSALATTHWLALPSAMIMIGLYVWAATVEAPLLAAVSERRR
jgi:protein-S-isoprenylcysteine O-methyltransferase Ste14